MTPFILIDAAMILQTIAQLAEQNASVLLTYGPLGVVCAWLMWKIERMEKSMVESLGTRLGDLAHRIDGLTRAMLVDMTERESAGERTKEYAREAIAKIDARSKAEVKPERQ